MTKDDIIKAAAGIISQEGYDKLTLSTLAGALGVRKASIYHHFDGKEAIIDALYKHFEEDALHLGFSVDLSKEPTEVLHLALSHWKGLFTAPSRQDMISLVEQRKEVDERAWDMRRALRLMIQSQLEAVLDNMASRGRIQRGLDIPLLAQMASSTLYEALVEGEPDADAFLDSLIDMISLG